MNNQNNQNNRGYNPKDDDRTKAGQHPHDEQHERSASGNKGNFAEGREKASEAGRKGGEQSQGGRH